MSATNTILSMLDAAVAALEEGNTLKAMRLTCEARAALGRSGDGGALPTQRARAQRTKRGVTSDAVLAYVSANPGVTTSQVAQAIGKHRGGVSPQMGLLAKSGRLARFPSGRIARTGLPIYLYGPPGWAGPK